MRQISYLYSSSTIASGSACSMASEKYSSRDGRNTLKFPKEIQSLLRDILTSVQEQNELKLTLKEVTTISLQFSGKIIKFRGLDNSTVRALHRHRRGQGSNTRSGLSCYCLKPGFHIVVSVVSVVRKKFIGQIEFILSRTTSFICRFFCIEHLYGRFP